MIKDGGKMLELDKQFYQEKYGIANMKEGKK